MKKLLKMTGIFALVLGLAATACDPKEEPLKLDTPTGLASSDVTTTGATLTWTAVGNAESYLVQINDGTPVSATSTTYTATGLAPETAYTWKVQAVAGESKSEWSSTSNFTTAAEPIVVPTGLASSDVTHNSAVLTWTAVADATAYEVKVGEAGAVAVTEATYLAEGLTANTEYSWTVRAIEGTKQSDWAENATFTTANAPILPAGLTVEGVTATGAIFWVEFPDGITTADKVSIKIQGEFSANIRPDLLSADGKEASLLNVAIDEASVNQGAWGANLADCLVSETEYTWQARFTIGEVQHPWAEGSSFTTPAIPEATPDYLSRIGNYTGNGTPSYFDTPRAPTWTGAITRPGDGAVDYYAVSGSFGENIRTYIDLTDGVLYLDSYTRVAATEGNTHVGYAMGMFVYNNQMMFLSQDPGSCELEWDPVAKTITYPKQLNFGGQYGVQTMMWGIPAFVAGGANQGQFAGAFSELYEDLVLTINSGTSVGTFSGTRVDMGEKIKLMEAADNSYTGYAPTTKFSKNNIMKKGMGSIGSDVIFVKPVK